MLRKLLKKIAYLRRVAQHQECPRLARWLLVMALAYLVSPIDLIPDFIPVLGQLDDVLIVGLLVWIAWKLVPDVVKQECEELESKDKSGTSDQGPEGE